jgi:hypothetical protein
VRKKDYPQCPLRNQPLRSTRVDDLDHHGRHRLNRGGDRHANCALWRVVIVRLATHQPTAPTRRSWRVKHNGEWRGASRPSCLTTS